MQLSHIIINTANPINLCNHSNCLTTFTSAAKHTLEYHRNQSVTFFICTITTSLNSFFHCITALTCNYAYVTFHEIILSHNRRLPWQPNRTVHTYTKFCTVCMLKYLSIYTHSTKQLAPYIQFCVASNRSYYSNIAPNFILQ